VSLGPKTIWANLYVDGAYWVSTPPSVFSWNSTTVSNGSHTISAKAFDSSDNLLGTSSIILNVANGSASATPTRTPTPTPTPASTATASASPPSSASPTASPTPTTAYYFSPTGSDSNPCTQSAPCWSLSKAQSVIGTAQPGTAILFQRGGSWSGGITMPTHINGTANNPIVIGTYGSGSAPIIDGGASALACFYARATGGGSTPLWSYITIDGFECRNTTGYGVLFYQNSGGSIGMPGIVVQNMNIHNTGPNTDDGKYRNQLMFLDENKGADGVQFLNNSVTSCGGHNCVQVQTDTGSPVISGNYCSGWLHNCIDVKGVKGAMVKGNTVNGAGSSNGSAFRLSINRVDSGASTRLDHTRWSSNNSKRSARDQL
jgi:hypothetical protein